MYVCVYVGVCVAIEPSWGEIHKQRKKYGVIGPIDHPVAKLVMS